MKKFLLGLVFLVFTINAQTILSPGDIVIVAINGDTDAPNSYGRGFSFMPLVNLEAGTVINFTDYGWSDLTGAFITNSGIADVFIHYSAPSAVTAGTIIRCDSYSNNNFTYDFSYSGSGNNYLNIAGLTQGDELLVFQGLRSSPTFIFAASIVNTSLVTTGWASNVGTNGTDGSGAGSALPGSGNVSVADLVDDVTAFSFNQASTENDNCAYSGITTATTMAGWRDRLKDYANWTFNDAIPIPTPPSGPFEVTDALPVELTSFSASVKQNAVTLYWQTAIEVNNHGFAVERSTVKGEWLKVGFIAGAGNSNKPIEYSFTDNTSPASNPLSYRLMQIDLDGLFSYSKEITVDASAMHTEFALEQNYPNPFNPSTMISYKLPMSNFVTLKVYNMLGQEVAALVNEQQSAGNYEVKFDASNLASGIYLYKLQVGEFSSVKKLILMK